MEASTSPKNTLEEILGVNPRQSITSSPPGTPRKGVIFAMAGLRFFLIITNYYIAPFLQQ
jgi:hypothetical protein